MNREIPAFIVTFLLIFAVIGICFGNLNPNQFCDDSGINTLTPSVLALALLSLGLFWENTKTIFEGCLGQLLNFIFKWICLGGFLSLLIFIGSIIILSGGGFFNIPFSMSALAIGLFLATRFLKYQLDRDTKP